jgi:hypothetical protein
MAEPDSSDLRVRVAIPYTVDDQRSYFNESYGGLWLTYQGFEYEQRYVLPYENGAKPEDPLFSPPPASEEPLSAGDDDNDE